MIQTIKNYLNKYHEANLWIEKRSLFEEKKHARQTPQIEPVESQIPEVVTQYGQVDFSHADLGRNQNPEERNKIQQVYSELEELVRFPQIAI